MENNEYAEGATFLSFPDEIHNEEYTYKRMSIRIYEPKALTTVSDELVAKLKNLDVDAKKVSNSSSLSSVGNNATDLVRNISQINELNGKFIAGITLPIPNELEDDQSHNFDQASGLVQMASDSTGISSLADGIVAKAANQMGMQKVMANPQYFQNYMGSGPRTFSFTFKFIPNSYGEAQRIISIINTIKKYASPNLQQNGLVMVAPNFFSVSFSNSTLTKLINMRPVVVSDVRVNYMASGVLDMTFDGMPKFITLGLTFKEIRAMRQSDYGDVSSTEE